MPTLQGAAHHARQRQLAVAAQAGNAAAEAELLADYEPRVSAFVRQATGLLCTGSLDAADLAQEARFAILRCIRKYDPAAPNTLFAYVEGALTRLKSELPAIRDVQVPRKAAHKIHRVCVARQTLGAKATRDAIADGAKVSRATLDNVWHLTDAPLESETLNEAMAAPEADEEDERVDALRVAIAQLPPDLRDAAKRMLDGDELPSKVLKELTANLKSLMTQGRSVGHVDPVLRDDSRRARHEEEQQPDRDAWTPVCEVRPWGLQLAFAF